MTIKHSSKSRKLNEVGKIFPDFFDLIKYTLITTIQFMVDDVKASRSFQTNGFKKFEVPYCLILKLVSDPKPLKLSLSYITKTGMIG